MKTYFRLLALGAAVFLSACASQISSTRGEIDARVDQAMVDLFTNVPGAEAVARQAAGILIIPRVNKGGFIYAGSYGEGALVVGGAKVDYFQLVSASFGLQAGAQRYKHALFFMTPEALAEFRTADGWELGLDAEYALPSAAGAATVSTGTFNKPIYAVIYGQEGIIVGASLEGTKYSRVVR